MILLVLCDYIFNSSRASNRQGSEKSRKLLCLLCIFVNIHTASLYNLEDTALRAIFNPSSLQHFAQLCRIKCAGKNPNKICFSAENFCIESLRLSLQTKDDPFFLWCKGF